MKRGIFIGRFQPFHLGHLQIIHEMEEAKDLDEIIIGIGTAQCGHTPYNPFTSEEREQMIKRSLNLRKSYHIVKIEDINDYPMWVSYVESLTPKFDVIYAGNTIVRKLFKEKEYELRFIESPINVSGTQIRQSMITGEDWVNGVPKGTRDMIYEINGISRIKKINSDYLNVGVTTDMIIHHEDKGIIFIKRKNEPYKEMWALPGGFLEGGQESIEEAAIRETKEETSLDFKVEDIKLVGVYSQPGRDPRGPTISVAFYVNTDNEKAKAGDDALYVNYFLLNNIPKELAFDHKRIIEDYINLKKKNAQIKIR